MAKPKKHPIDYADPKTRREILVRQRRGLWTPEQVANLAAHFRLRPGKLLLDCGCGLGYALRTWGPYCLPRGRLTGIDREEHLLRDARKLADQEGLGRVTGFVQGDICDLPFPDRRFDITIAHVVLCHLADPERALDEMVRVTRRGGCVAVFDNAIGGGASVGWNNLRRPALRDVLFFHEAHLRMLRGRKHLGHGDFTVGCHLPMWFEARGLRDVDVRANERVSWVAPPYRSLAQRTEYRNLRERIAENVDRRPERHHLEELRAGGADEGMVASYRRRLSRGGGTLRQAFRKGRLAYTWAGQFWCVWGFRP